MKRVNIHLKEDQIKELQKIADKQEASLAYVIRMAIKTYLNIHNKKGK